MKSEKIVRDPVLVLFVAADEDRAPGEYLHVEMHVPNSPNATRRAQLAEILRDAAKHLDGEQ